MNHQKEFYSTREWRELRELALKRDNYTCQRCGRSRGDKTHLRRRVSLVAHHIKPRSQGGADRLENLATLCRSCHSSIPLSDDHKRRISQGLTGIRKRGGR